MGTGKTTIGRQLAKRLSMTFYDADRELENRTGAKIALIFDIEGEAGFRQREADILSELVQLDNIVLATGGGAVLKPENRDLLRGNGIVVYLKSSPELLLQRTKGDKRRPLLQAEDRMAQIVDLLNVREPLYSSSAHEIIETDKLTTKRIIQKLVKIKQ